MQNIISICIFGSYDPEYSRNKILIDGLQKNGVVVYHCRSTKKSVLRRYPELIRKYWQIKNQVLLLYVGFFGHLDMPLAWILARLTGKSVVFDMFYSMYDTYINDRQSTSPGSLLAWSYFLIDKVAATLADLVITDTKAHANYFIKQLSINPRKLKRIFVGGDDTIFKPLDKTRSQYITIEFHGYFTRLHGAEYYVEAAKLLENEKNLRFLLIGHTSTYPVPLERYKKLKPKTMKYIPELTTSELTKTIARVDISIGHMGTIQKARNVITNKIFHALACKTTVIVGDCPASRELLRSGQTAVFTKMGDAQDLADKILYLAREPVLRRKIAANGFALHEKRLTNFHIGQALLSAFSSLF